MLAIEDPIICYQLAGYERLQTPIWIFDIQNLKIIWANRAALRLWNAVSLKELLNRDLSQICAANYTRWQSYLEQLKQGETFIEQFTLYPEENAVSVRCNCSGIPLENGRLVMLVEAEKNANVPSDTLLCVEALHHTKVIISLCNESGELLFQNSAAINCYGNHISNSENQYLKQRFFNQNIWQQVKQEVITQGIYQADIQVLTQQGVRWHSLEIRLSKNPLNECNMLLVNEHDIRERKRIEEQLQLADFSVENSSLATVWIDRNAKIIRANRKACEEIGFSREELLSMYVWDCNPNFPKELWNVHWEELKKQKTMFFTSEHRNKDGTIIPIEITLNYLHFNGKEYNFAYINNISERKKSEATWQHREQEFRALVENAPDIIMRLDREFRYLYINPTVEKHLGVPASAFIGKNMAEFGAAESLVKLWETTIETVFITGEEQEIEFESPSTKGILNYASRVVPEFASDGSVQSVLAIARDISDRVAAEKALRQNEERMQALLKAIPDTMFRHRVDGTYLDVQANGNKLLVPPEFLIGKNLKDLNMPVHIKNGLLEHFQIAVNTGNLQTFEHDLEKPDGAYTYEARIIKSGSDEVVCIVRDITERKQAEEALQNALAAAQAASISKSRFLSHMSHELRTPLNAILGFSQVLARSNSLSVEQQEQLKIINRSGEHLLNLINDILSMSKIEAGQITLSENCFDLYQLLDDIEKMLTFKAAAKGLQLVFERSANVPQYIEADESKLRQILINLLGNAVKFTNKGGIYLRVSLASKKQNQSLIIFEVEDTGAGIAGEEISTVFDPFVQSETGRKSMQGTGLGLPISRQFIRLMGGDITVKSQVSKGTIFTFNIQVKEVDPIPEKTSLASQRVIGLQPNQPTYRILIVEDIEENRLLLVKLLQPLGFEVREAVNGEEAIALWSTWQPHLIWMDMRMPIMDGYEATKQIKALQQQRLSMGNAPKTVIIALTASAFEEEQLNIFSSGCDDLVRKPFQESELFAKMAQYLGIRYIYADVNQPNSLIVKPTKKLQVEDLTVMPMEWIAQLNEAALCVNDEIILQLVKQIPTTEAALADTITDLVSNFRLDLILELTESIIPPE